MDTSWLHELKSATNVHRFVVNENRYGILIVSRGELLFFQENDRALFCEISARESLIDPGSVKRWDDKTPVSAEEKTRLLPLMQELYKRAYKDELRIWKE